MNTPQMQQARNLEVTALQRAMEDIPAIAAMLQLICQQTQMGFAAVARVTDESWVACAVCDTIGYGILPGTELPVETTLCLEAKHQGAAIVIEQASTDPVYADHQTPKLYKFESYVSVPVSLKDGSYFGNLCAVDPAPRLVRAPHVVAMFSAYAALLGHLIDSERVREDTVQMLAAERSIAVSREQFIAVVAHDLRNPLSAIASGSELICRYGEPGVVSVGARMRASVQRMTALLNDLVDFAKGRAGQTLSIHLQAHSDLKEGLELVVSELKDANPYAAIVPVINIGATVVCDLPRVQQLLSNLLGNAIAYGAKGAPILVEAFVDGQFAVVKVTNTGTVIPAAHLEHLFDPYWRAPATEGSDGVHMGLGLHICSQVMRAHGGTLKASSSEIEGTRFEARWPATVSI